MLCFVLLEERMLAPTGDRQRLTQPCEAFSFMSNVTSVLSEFIVSSLLIFPDIFVEFAFSVENEISNRSLSSKMLVV